MREQLKKSNSSANGFSKKMRNEANMESSELLIKEAIFVRHAGSLVKLKFTDILWLKADGNYTTLVSRTAVFSLRNILKDFEDMLPAKEFMRIHRSYMVRIDEIESINPKDVKVAGDLVPIGRNFYQDLIRGIQKVGFSGD